MKASWLARPYRAAATLLLGLATISGYAGTVPTQQTTSQPTAGTVAAGPNGNLLIEHPNMLQHPIPQGQTGRGLETPFSRIVAPHLQEWMRESQVRGHALNTPAISGGAGGTGVTAPSFVTAPYVLIQNNDNNPAWSSVTADFNNDGNPDVATVQQDGTVNVILNPGSFAKIASVAPLAPNTSEAANRPDLGWVTAADLNNDGFPDLIGMDFANDQIVVWMGNGDGTFKNAVTYSIATNSGATWTSGGGGIVVADFNGDGFPDIATVELAPVYKAPYQTTVTEQTYINDGTGKLLPGPETDTVFHDLYFAGTETLDVVTNDGNSASGLIVEMTDEGANGGEASVGIDLVAMASNSDGSFQSPVEPSGPLTQDYGILVDQSLYATNLETNFKTSSANSERKGGAQKIRAASTIGTGIPTADIVFMTGDGAIYDAPYSGGNPTSVKVLAGQNSEASFFGNASAPRASSRTKAATTASNPSLTAYPFQGETVLNVADMDGDGYLDVLLYVNGAVYILPNGGNGAFSALPTQLAGGTGGDEQPQPADFDGSGKTSLVWVDALLDQVGYYQSLNAEQGSTKYPGTLFGPALVSGVNATGNYVDLGNNLNVQVVGDFNGDGLQDVIAYDWSDYDDATAAANPGLVLGINQGAGIGQNQTNNFAFTTILSAQAMAKLPAGNPNALQGLGFMNPVPIMNASGASVLVASFGGLYTLPIHLDGTQSTPVALNLGVATQCWTAYADVADINGDGIPDLVVPYEGDASCGAGSQTPSGYFTFIGNADGSFQTATFTPFGGSLLMAKLINVGGGSTPDLVLLDQDYANFTFNTYVLKSNGDGTFNYKNPVNIAPNYVASAVIAGDFNMDGKQDITLVVHGEYDPSTNGIVPNTPGALLIPNQGNYTFGLPSLVDLGFWPIAGAYADFNGDGSPDLALLDYASETSNYVPAVKILPNLGGGNFGSSISFMDSFYAPNHSVAPAYIFPGNFGNDGGQDFLVTTGFDTAEFLNQGSTSLSLAAAPATVAQGAPVTLTATLTQPIGGSTPTGTVTFSLGGTALGSAAVSSTANGVVATLTTTALPVGTDAVTASYSGDQTHNVSTASANVTVAAASPTFAVTASPSSLTLSPGETGTVTLSLAANGTFSGAISFSCSGAPSEASCTVAPTTLTLGPNQSGTVAVVVATTATNNQYQASGGSAWKMAAGGISFAGVFFLILPRRRRWSGTGCAVVLALFSFGSIAMLSGCGGSNRYPGTPAGASTITVTAASGSVTQTQTIALTMTQPQQ